MKKAQPHLFVEIVPLFSVRFLGQGDGSEGSRYLESTYP